MVINNERISGWEHFSIGRSLDSLCGSFSIKLFNITGSITDEIQPQTNVKIFVGEKQLINATVDTRSKSEDKNKTTLSIGGRDVTSVLVDCSAITSTSYFENKTVTQIINDICRPFKIKVICNIYTKIKTFSIQNGETAADTIQRLCRMIGVIAYTSNKGELIVTEITIASLKKAKQKIERPGNIKSISEDLDYSERFSAIYVKGQDSGDGKAWTKEQLQQVAKVTDKNVSLYRPKVVVADSKSTQKDLERRANYEAQYRAGKSKSYNVSMWGFRQNRTEEESDDIWDLGLVTQLFHDKWEVSESRIISNINYEYTKQNGTITAVGLSDVRTYLSNPSNSVGIK